MITSLRLMTEADLPLLLAWRNLKEVQRGIYSQRNGGQALDWRTHEDWHRSRGPHWRRFIIMCGEHAEAQRPVGYVYISQLDSWSPELGYAVGEPCLWGKGVGKEAVRQALSWLRLHDYQYAHTTVLKANGRSLKLLSSLGFTIQGEARDEEWYLTAKLAGGVLTNL